MSASALRDMGAHPIRVRMAARAAEARGPREGGLGQRSKGLVFFRDHFAHCPWVHISQAGEQCESEDLAFCLPYGSLCASES